jgi:hypothetical protein
VQHFPENAARDHAYIITPNSVYIAMGNGHVQHFLENAARDHAYISTPILVSTATS